MKKYDLVIFDKDGTLLDTSLGIYNTNRKTMEKLGIPQPPPEKLKEIMGPPLEYCFHNVCGVPMERLQEAIDYYMVIYKEAGMHEMEPYDGMIDTLQRLKDAGCKLGVATLKEHVFVGPILEENNMLHYMDAYHGSTHDAQGLITTKTAVIRKCMEDCGVDPSRTLMVGDSRYDGEGAMEAGVDFVGVTYGFSIHSPADLEGVPFVLLADTPQAVADFVLGKEE